MPFPDVTDVRVDSALTQFAINYVQNADGFFARKLFPVVPVDKKSGYFFTFDRGDMFRDEARKRAPGTVAGTGGFAMSSTQYDCTAYAYRHAMPWEVLENSDLADIDQASVAHVQQKIMIHEDRNFASNFLTTGVWGTDLTPGTLWSAGGDPFGDIRTGIQTVQKQCGSRANVLFLSQEVWDVLADHADTLDRIKHTQMGVVTTQLLAAALDLDEVVVGGSVYDSAAEGQTESPAFTTGKHALLLYRAKSPGIMEPSAGYTFSWSPFDRGAAENMAAAVRTYDQEDRKVTWFDGEVNYDMQLTASGCGYFFNGAVA